MKKILLVFALMVLCVAFAACGAGKTNAPAEPLNLTGEWKQVNSNSDTAYQAATISGDVIEVYWVNDEDDSKALYWAGTYIEPGDAAEPYSWDSVNDTEKTDFALLASGDETKTFTYQSKQISYSVSAMGVTQTVKLEKQ